MNSFYADENIFTSLKELMEELAMLEANCADLIDKELEKYTVDGDVGQVVHMVHACVDIKYNDGQNNEVVGDKSTKRRGSEDIDSKTHILTPNKNNRSSPNVNLIDEYADTNLPDRGARHDNMNSRDNSLMLDRSDNDLNRSEINLNKDDSVSLIDVQVEQMDSELLEVRSNDESINDHSTSNIQNTSVLSKNQELKKNHSFFRNNTFSKPVNISPPTLQEGKEPVHRNATMTQSNIMFLPEGYRKSEIMQSMVQKNTQGDQFANARDRFTIGTHKKQMPSWNEQSNDPRNAKLDRSPMRRPTVSNKLMPASSKQIAIESDTEVNMSRMSINDHVLPQIIMDIMKNKKVKAINFSHNSITEIGFEQMLKKLALHPTLERVYLMNNYLDDSVFNKLEAWAKKIKKINYFNFQNCSHFKNMVKIKKQISALAKSGIKIDI